MPLLIPWPIPTHWLPDKGVRVTLDLEPFPFGQGSTSWACLRKHVWAGSFFGSADLYP